jgi:hypothetical protein
MLALDWWWLPLIFVYMLRKRTSFRFRAGCVGIAFLALLASRDALKFYSRPTACLEIVVEDATYECTLIFDRVRYQVVDGTLLMRLVE